MKFVTRAIIPILILAMMLPGMASAEDTTVVTLTTFEDIVIDSCAGTILAIQYKNCGPALLPLTDGESTADHLAAPGGDFWLRNHVSGGSALESRFSETRVTYLGEYELEDPVRSVALRLEFTLTGGSADVSVRGSADFDGYAGAVNFPAQGSRELMEPSCDDGGPVQATGQTGGSLFKLDTPPGTYALRITYSCVNGGLIKAGEVFRGTLTARGITSSRDSGEHATVEYAASLDQITWTLTP